MHMHIPESIGMARACNTLKTPKILRVCNLVKFLNFHNQISEWANVRVNSRAEQNKGGYN